MIAVSEPKVKPEDKYLNPSSWCGEPVPSGLIGPWGLGQTCVYVLAEGDGWQEVFAAETAERAQAAAHAWTDRLKDVK